MRILHIDSGVEMRGGQWQVLRLIQGVDARSEEVALMAPKGAPLYEKVKHLGFNVIPLSWGAMRRESARVDIVHCHGDEAHRLAWMWSKRPFVVSRRVGFPVRKSLFSGRQYRAARGYLAVSDVVAEQLEKAGVSRERIEIVGDGMDTPPFISDRTKGILALDSNDSVKCKGLLDMTGLRITFARDLEGTLPTASIFLYATHMEGLGSAALMAMSYGVPVVASRVGGLCELIRDGTNGMLVDNKPEEFADAVQRLQADESLTNRIIRNGRATVAQSYNVRKMVTKTLEFYGRVLD